MTIVVTAFIMVVIGAVAALIWWSLADVIFPGASRKTGQSIGLRRGERKADGEVIRDFDRAPPPENRERP